MPGRRRCACRQILGVVGLECYGDVGLLRSLAVSPEVRGRGLGVKLVQALMVAFAAVPNVTPNVQFAFSVAVQMTVL